MAPVGTTATICAAMSDTMAAGVAVPVNVTVELRRLAPAMVTVAPIRPLVGAKLDIVGGGITVKIGLVATPPGVVTVMTPLDAPAGTTATILLAVSLFMIAGVNVPVKMTEIAFAKPVPVIVTVPPTGPLVGEMAVMVGTVRTVKMLGLVAVPPGVVTVTRPDVAPAGTVVVTVVAVLLPTTPAVPLKLTAVAPARLVPVMVTAAPTSPLVGAKLVILGVAMIVNVALEALPPAVVTLMGPVAAPAGTVATI